MNNALVSAARGATAAMGTRFEIVVATDDEWRVQPLIEAALAEIEELHTKLTRFSSDSLISHINRTAALTPVRLDVATFALFEAAAAVKQRSRDAFDIALGSGNVLLDRAAHTVQFDRDGVSLDLGGIAKGYALDRAAEILRGGGVGSALLHGGSSSVLAIGAPPDALAWRIGLAHIGSRRSVELCDRALSVSRPFSQAGDGQLHIIDPRSGAAVQQRWFTVVTGPSACLADAWSTALAVLGQRPPDLPEEWTTLIEPEHA